MWSRGLFVLSLLAAIGAALVGAVAQPRSAASLQIEKALDVMKVITSKPYSFVGQEIVGRTDDDLETWSRHGWELADFILRVNPSEIDDTALDHLIDQIYDPSAWPPSPLERPLGHMGSRAIMKLIGRIDRVDTSSDRSLPYRLSEHLLAAVRYAGSSNVDDRALGQIEALLDHAEGIVRSKAVETLGELGPRAHGALPKIEKLFEIAREEKRRQTLIMGPTTADVMGMAISKIKGEPIRYDY